MLPPMSLVGPGVDSCGDDGLHSIAGARPGKWSGSSFVDATASGIAGMNGLCYSFASGNALLQASLAAAEEDDVAIMGARWRPNGAWNTDNVGLFNFASDAGATRHITICLNASTGRIIAKLGTQVGTVLGQSVVGVVAQNQTNYIEAKVVLGDSTNGSVVVRVDRQVVLNLTGIDTKNGGTKTVFDTLTAFSWGFAGVSAYLDDIYLANGLGSANNDFLGSGVVEARRPDGNGNYSQWLGQDGNNTDNYLLVDDPVASPDDDTTYVEEGTVGERDSYAMQNLVSTAGTPKAVVARVCGRYTGGGAENLQIMVRRSATDSDGPTLTLPASYGVRSRIMDIDPIAAGAWTIANVNSMEVGQVAVA